MTDILINLRTTYLTKNMDEIISGKKIAMNYISGIMFWFDLLSTLPIGEFADIVFSGSNS